MVTDIFIGEYQYALAFNRDASIFRSFENSVAYFSSLR